MNAVKNEGRPARLIATILVLLNVIILRNYYMENAGPDPSVPVLCLLSLTSIYFMKMKSQQ